MSSGTAGAAGLASAAGFSAGASLQAARKHAARMLRAAFRRSVRRTATRFLVNPLFVPDGKDGMAAGSLARVRKQSHSVRFSIRSLLLLLSGNRQSEGRTATILAVACPPRKKSSVQVAFLMR